MRTKVVVLIILGILLLSYSYVNYVYYPTSYQECVDRGGQVPKGSPIMDLVECQFGYKVFVVSWGNEWSSWTFLRWIREL